MKKQEQNYIIKDELSLEEIKQIELDILVEFDRICRENNLRYYLAYGTLLGAIRHKGFIPWDDDIDIMIPRPDYKKFLSVFYQKCDQKKFGLASMHIDNEFFAPLAKMYKKNTLVLQEYGQIEKSNYGVYIDLFIIDGLPSNSQESFYRKAERLRRKWGLANRDLLKKRKSRNLITHCVGSLLSLLCKLRGYKYYRDLYDKHASMFDFEKARDVAVVLYGEGLTKEKMAKMDLENPKLVCFENMVFPTVNNPDKYLHQMYGDYMKLPPESERISKHPHKIYRIMNQPH